MPLPPDTEYERPFATADLYDEFHDLVQVVEPIFRNYGGNPFFHGPVECLKVYEDNSLVREKLGENGGGKVLVVDGGGSTRVALLGDRLAAMALQNDWAGVVIFGCVRDSRQLAHLSLGVKALNTCPARSLKRGEGQRDLPLRFAGALFSPGHYLYSDEDGILVAEEELLGK